MRRPSVLVLLAVVATAAAPARAGGPAVVAVGGEFNDAAIYDEVLRLAGGASKAKVGILTIGSSPAKAEKNGRFYIDKFRGRGAAEVTWLSIDADRAHLAEDAALAAAAAGMNVIVLGGGEQDRYTRVLLRPDGSDTALLAAIRRGAGASGVIAGTSAGAAALVDGPMINGGESYDALARPERVTSQARGLGFFRRGLIDTHFAERGRQARLIHLASRAGAKLAFGVDEDTALVATEDGMHVVGRGGVNVFDLTRARVRGATGRWGIDNVRAHVLRSGDRFDPRARRVRVAAGRERSRGAAPVRAADRADVFSAVDPASDTRAHRRAFVRLAAAALSRGARPVVAHPAEDRARRVTLRRGRGAARNGRTLRNLRVDIR